MKELITYMADDGTIFNDYEECVKYEDIKNREAAKDQLHFYNYKFQIIADETLSKEKAPQVLSDCRYLFIGNEAAIRLVDEIAWYLVHCNTPRGIGYWYYSPKEKLWFSLTGKIEELKKELNTFENTLKNLKVR